MTFISSTASFLISVQKFANPMKVQWTTFFFRRWTCQGRLQQILFYICAREISLSKERDGVLLETSVLSCKEKGFSWMSPIFILSLLLIWSYQAFDQLFGLRVRSQRAKWNASEDSKHACFNTLYESRGKSPCWNCRNDINVQYQIKTNYLNGIQSMQHLG